MAASALQFENVSFRYASQAEPTLKNIDFSIERGSKTLVLGPSGSGKSTLLALINALLTKEQGELTGRVMINGQDQAGQDPFDRSLLVGTILQDTDRQFVGLTVAEDIAFVLENEQEPVKKLHEVVDRVAERFGLTDLLPLGPNSLSGGQKQRVAMAGVLVGNSPILVLDEPLASLDPKAGQALLATIEELHQEGITILMVEHRLDEVLRQGIDQVLVLDDGQLVFDGSSDDLLKQPNFHQWQLAQPADLSLIERSGYELAKLVNVSNPATIDGPGLAEAIRDFSLSKSQENVAPLNRNVALKVHDIRFSYGQHEILKDISLQVHEKEWLALIGQNGSGKSTLSRLLAGFLPIQSGRVVAVEGDQTFELNELSLAEKANYIGYVSQNPNEMLIGLTVFEEVAVGLRLRGVDESTIQDRVLDALKQAKLFSYRNWSSQMLSFGQKRRLSVLAVAILEPKVLILDEPTAGQDDVSAKGLLDYLDTLRTNGLALITVTHDMALIEKRSDRVLSLKDGQIALERTAAELFSDEQELSNTSLIEPSDQILMKRFLTMKGGQHE